MPAVLYGPVASVQGAVLQTVREDLQPGKVLYDVERTGEPGRDPDLDGHPLCDMVGHGHPGRAVPGARDGSGLPEDPIAAFRTRVDRCRRGCGRLPDPVSDQPYSPEKPAEKEQGLLTARPPALPGDGEYGKII